MINAIMWNIGRVVTLQIVPKSRGNSYEINTKLKGWRLTRFTGKINSQPPRLATF